jgi:uncharacterized membrane protein (Fun14 family)
MNIVESFGPAAATLCGGFFVGVLFGYALKKVIKNSSCNSRFVLSWISLSSESADSEHKLE